MSFEIKKESDFDTDKVAFDGYGYGIISVPVGTVHNCDFKISGGQGEFRLVQGGQVLVKHGIWGDYCDFQVVDVDNILGYGNNTVLKQYVTHWMINPEVMLQGDIKVTYVTSLPSGMYLRIIYHSIGSITNPEVGFNLWAHKILS